MCLLLWLHVGHPFWLSHLEVLIPMYIKRKIATFYSSVRSAKNDIFGIKSQLCRLTAKNTFIF